LDAADEQRRNREHEGVFLNHIQFADMRYGGGSVSIGGRQVVVSPVDMATTRPTIINSVISRSADAAIAATPDSFAETRFTSSFFQGAGAFTPDYSRIGPEIHGNTVIDNSINGLFVRLVTRTGDVLETAKDIDPDAFDEGWNARRVSVVLRRYGLRTTRSHGKRLYRLNASDVATVAKRYGYEIDETESTVPQTTGGSF
jgi:hypothetical protein